MRHALAVLCVAWLTACGGGLWSAGLPDEGPEVTEVVANGVVLVTGPLTWQEAAERTTLAWTEQLPSGLVFDSVTVQAEVPGSIHMTASVVPRWTEAVLRPGHVGLAVGPLGIEMEIAVVLEPVTVTLEQGGAPACLVDIAIPSGRLSGIMTLTKSKLGVIHLSPIGAAALRQTDVEFELRACDEALLARSGEPEGPELLALEALADAAFEALTPAIATALPTCLGMDLAGATTVVYEDGGLGSGWQHVVVRAPLVAPNPWWQFASGQLVIPYSVGVSAEAHGCVPQRPLPVAMSAAVPVVDSDWSLMLNQQVVARLVAATWKAGGLCGDRLAADAAWPGSEWSSGWPMLQDMDPDMTVSARVWPEEAPEVTFSTDQGRTKVDAHIDAGAWRVELMGWRDEARVRLATVEVVVTARAAVDASPTGEIWLSVDTVDVGILGTEAGLMAPPDNASVAAQVEAIVRSAVEARPLWTAPTIPTGVTPNVELHDAYLVIRDG